jgi:signal transduction histidine kinase
MDWLFDTTPFVPRTHCGTWQPWLIAVNQVGQTLVCLAYFGVCLALVILWHARRREFPKAWVILAFSIVFFWCGAGHLVEVLVFWWAPYRLFTLVTVCTALFSVPAAIALPSVVRYLIRMPSPERYESLLRAMSLKVDELAQVSKYKSEFLANVSHELRTPLTLILGPVRKRLAVAELPKGELHDLEVVERNALTMLRHVNDLLDLSKMEAGGLELNYQDLDLAQLARFVASHFENLAAEHHIHFELDVPAILSAQADGEKLQRVLLNLLSNAFKFTPDGGTIRLALTSGRGQVQFVVQDTGPGVPPHLREVIFERFRQGESDPARRPGGTGLGLAIVKEFVHLHGGTARVSEAVGGGAVFTVTLPDRAPAGALIRGTGFAPAVDLARQAAYALKGPAVSGNGEGAQPAQAPLVLVVEDNPDMNAFLVECLGGTYRTASAHDGREGLDKTVALRPDLIVCDYMMPRMTGGDMIREIRQRPDLEQMPILMLTASAEESMRVKLLREGVQDYMSKPFATEELLARAAGLIDQYRRAQLDREESHRKATLLKEIHHRVKNNLTVISSLLYLQSRMSLDAKVVGALQESQGRVKSMALIHEKLYRSHDLEKLAFGDFVRDLMAEMVGTYGVGKGDVAVHCDVENVSMGIDTAVPCGLIVNELLSNALKHAFPKGRRGDVWVDVRRNQEGKYVMSVRDNGIGLAGATDWRRSKSLGLKLVEDLTKQLDGNLVVSHTEGASFQVTFSEVQYKERK